MSFPTIFANLAAGNQRASLLDEMFAILGGAAPIPCTATGTNAITLTPNTNEYLPAAYANFQPVIFAAAASSSGSVTIRLGALAFVKLFMPSGLQAGSGDITSGALIIASFNSALDSGNGGFQVFNATTPSVIQPVMGTFKNLVITNGGTPDTQVAVTADEVMLENAAGGTAKVGSFGSPISLTISTGSSGVNGLDTGSMANNTFYSVWVIYNGTTASGMISLQASANAVTMPSGYTYRARVGWVRTGAASTNLHRITQRGNLAQYVVTAASQTVNMPKIVGGSSGDVTIPTWTATSTAAFVPSTAASILFSLQGTASGTCMAAPNNSYGSASSTTNPPPVEVFAPASSAAYIVGEFLLESANIYYASNAANNSLWCRGWRDNI